MTRPVDKLTMRWPTHDRCNCEAPGGGVGLWCGQHPATVRQADTLGGCGTASDGEVTAGVTSPRGKHPGSPPAAPVE